MIIDNVSADVSAAAMAGLALLSHLLLVAHILAVEVSADSALKVLAATEGMVCERVSDDLVVVGCCDC